MELIIYLNLTLPVLDVQIVTEECHFRPLLLCFISRGRSLLRASRLVCSQARSICQIRRKN